MRSGWAITVLCVAVGCGEEGGAAPAEPRAEAEENTPEVERPEEQPAVAERVPDLLANTRVHLDLLALAHLADVEHHGLYVDFGTPARMHYTMGRWHNG